MNKYIVNLNNSINNEEDHKKNEKNLIRIKVFDKNGNIINKDLYTVQIEFSKDGALGFGKELIRASFNKDIDEYYHNHIPPVTNGKAIQNMGICVTHDSPEFTVAFQDLGNIVDEIEKSKTE